MRKIAVRRKIDSDLAEKAVGILTVVADEVTLKRKHDEMEIILVFNAENEEVIDLTEEDDAFRIFLESGKEEEEGMELIFEGDERDKGKAEEESVGEADKLDKLDKGDKVSEVGEVSVSKADEAEDGGWLRKGNYIYRIKDGFVEAKYKSHRLKLPFETVKSIFDEMPDEATAGGYR